MHEMRVRIMTAPAFTGDKVIGAILFEATMDGQAQGKPVPAFLWEDRGVVPFLKVDKGLEAEKDGVRLMKPMPELDALLARAVKLGVFGTKMRSVIDHASQTGIAAIVKQQFEVGRADRRARAHAHHRARGFDQEPGQGRGGNDPPRGNPEAARRPAGWPQGDAQADDPGRAGFLSPLIEHERVARVVALSGGYTRADACQRLARNHGMIASFSRALTEGLTKSMSDAEFNAALGKAIDEIYQASTVKV